MGFQRCTVVSTVLFALLAPVVSVGSSEAVGVTLTATWTDNSDGTAYTRIERRLDSEAAFTELADAEPGETEYVDTAVHNGATYCYRVFAWVVDGVSPYTDEVCARPVISRLPALGR